MKLQAAVERVEVRVFKIPTETPESDGTYRWSATTLLVVQILSAGERGLGYSYATPAAGALIMESLAPVLEGRSPLDTVSCWNLMIAALRNLGASGIGMLAVSALDAALWDLKAKLLGLSLLDLLGAARDAIPVYGSGGFTSYTIDELQRQLGGWAGQGILRVKMKVGRHPEADSERVVQARQAIGEGTELYVDANGGYAVQQALGLAERYAALGVTWFEEPVQHQDFAGLCQLRKRMPPGMEIASGEYGFELDYYHRLLQAGAVDVVQADATRCGITGFLQVAALCSAYRLPLSSHCAPSLHLPLCCAVVPARHLEYFHDHVRIEQHLFEGTREPVAGVLAPDRHRPGLGLALREDVARRYEIQNSCWR
ncbi:mandelate racemase [Geomonas limicola]|uniref:Mandelate racemase n=1 Tax=Geomonas limicola TaxID=2740186 RepID=A0A6V8N214_9BACT|nr:enolase C-terminal domain-like protein [Geomonas limicola]GFO66512.1 mandelate racemase [Geomonas limicola]